ncbi:MAG: tetratricopeptide repeat protein [Candidatus Schekmanbacteria bacterium]|nr:tetratricopeptide repeat protein [Candidatus Schekmanbacteria bacterium]
MNYNQIIRCLLSLIIMSSVLSFTAQSKALVEPEAVGGVRNGQNTSTGGTAGENVDINTLIRESEKNPSDISLKEKLAIAYIKEKKYDNAIQIFQKILSINSGSAIHHNALGSVYGLKGDINKAVEEYKLAVKFDPGFAEAHKNLGNAYIGEKKLDEALKEFNTALKLKPDYFSVMNNIASLYLLQQKYDEALKKVDEVLTRSPSYIPALRMKGIIYLRSGKYKEATKEFLDVQEKNPKDPLNTKYLAGAYVRMGDFIKAVEYCKKYIELMPSTSDIQDYKDFIKIYGN